MPTEDPINAPRPASSTVPPSTATDAEAGDEGESAGEAFRDAGRYIGELKEYAGHYASAKLDSFKGSIRRLVLMVVIGIIMGVIGISILVTAGVLFLNGLAGALGQAFGRAWVGDLIIGGVILAVVLGSFGLVRARMLGSWRKATVRKYEKRRTQQRRDRGYDVEERAREAGDAAASTVGNG